MARAFPSAPMYTSLFEPEETFASFGEIDLRTSALNRWSVLRSNHRLALPLLASSFGRLDVDADVVLCSSSGWAHGARTSGRKVVYCYNPARWLYQRDQYFAGCGRLAKLSASAFRRPLIRWDHRAARRADRYIATSTVVRDRIRATYGIDAEILPAPHAADVAGERRPMGIEPGYFLAVGRLMAYKNFDATAAAFAELPGERLVVVGSGPEEHALRRVAPANVTFLSSVSDPELRWLYANARGLIAASYEDFGLTPIEAAAFGVPSAVLRWGGFLDTVIEAETGVFFDEPDPSMIAAAVRRLARLSWVPAQLAAHADRYSEARFAEGLQAIVADEAALAGVRTRIVAEQQPAVAIA